MVRLLHFRGCLGVSPSSDDDFVDGNTIKYHDGELAEIGFMLIIERYRQMGLTDQMVTKMLYAKIRG